MNSGQNGAGPARIFLAWGIPATGTLVAVPLVTVHVVTVPVAAAGALPLAIAPAMCCVDSGL